MVQVFISYSSADQLHADMLGAVIDGIAGAEPYFFKEHKDTSSPIEEKVRSAIEKSAFVVMIISENSLESDWLPRELNWSVGKDICIYVPDDSRLPVGMPTRFEVYRDVRSISGAIRNKVLPIDAGTEQTLSLIRESVDAKFLCYISLDRFGEKLGTFHAFGNVEDLAGVENIMRAYRIDPRNQIEVYNKCVEYVASQVAAINDASAIRDMNQGEIVRLLIDVEVGGFFYERIAKGYDLFAATMIEEHVPECMSKMRELKNSIRHITRL